MTRIEKMEIIVSLKTGRWGSRSLGVGVFFLIMGDEFTLRPFVYLLFYSNDWSNDTQDSSLVEVSVETILTEPEDTGDVGKG